MTNLENAIVFESKRSRKNIENIKNEIFFSIFKSKKGYLTLKVQIGFDIARKVKITEESKIKLGCDREDKTIWYLIIGEEGFSISKSKNESSYNSAIRWPFQFLDKKNMKIGKENIEINSDKRIITLYVFDYIKTEELIIRDSE